MILFNQNMSASYEQTVEGLETIGPVPPVKPEQLRDYGLRYPELSVDIALFLLYGGDAETLPDIGDSFLKDDLLCGLEESDCPAADDGDFLEDSRNYIIQARTRHRLTSFGELEAGLDSPELHGALGILQAEQYIQREVPDQAAMLIAEAMLREQIAHRHGIRPQDINRHFEPNAWREYTHGVFRIEEDPPQRKKPDIRKGDDFFERRLEAIDFLGPQLCEILNHIGFQKWDIKGSDGSEHDPFVLNGNIISASVDGTYVREYEVPDDQEDAFEDDEEDEPRVIVIDLLTTDGISMLVDLDKLLIAIAGAHEFGSGISNIPAYIALDNLPYANSLNEFKTAFAVQYHSMRTGIEIPDFSDEGIFGHSLIDLLTERHILEGGEIKVQEVFDDDTSDASLAKGSTPEERNKITAHNNDTPDRREIGRVVVGQASTYPTKRMVCFETAIPYDYSSTRRPRRFDIELDIQTPYILTDRTRQLPNMPGYRLVGYQPVTRQSNGEPRMAVQYKKEAHDPYLLPTIAIEPVSTNGFADKLRSMGLGDCAEELEEKGMLSVEELFDTIGQHAHYGTGSRRLSVTARRLETLFPFVENGQLIGTCTVFAAIGKYALDDLLPDSQAQVVSGHTINYDNTIYREGHAQILFQHNGLPYITDFSGSAPRKKSTKAAIKQVSDGTFDDQLTALSTNLQVGMRSLLTTKYVLPPRAKEQLMDELVKKRPEHFGRRTLSLYMRLEHLQASSPFSQHAAVLETAAETHALLERWKILKESPSERQSIGWSDKRITDVFGDWSDDEITFMQAGLSRIDATYQRQNKANVVLDASTLNG
jgi:hypothetical protein